MLSVDQAQDKILSQARLLRAELVPLTPDVLGLVLAEDIASDLDMPPFDKALMDGYAVRAHDLAQGKARLRVIEEVSAGKTPSLTLAAGQATRIMTGAPIPEGADAVVMVERTELVDVNLVLIGDQAKPGQNILRRGREMHTGETVLAKGSRIRPQELGLLATVGRTHARVQPRAPVAVLSTGDEIIEASEKPGPAQIRNGNGPMLLALAARAGAAPRALGIARDRLDSLQPLVAQGLTDDVLVLSGGVSAGKLDLVPGVLADQGVEAIFHKVEMKPGRPIFFGVLEKPSGRCLVFGLPGNPVSALVCFELFVRPALHALMGLEPGPRVVSARLAEDYPYRSDRPTYHPAVLTAADDGWSVRAVPWFGSPDLRGVTPGNAFVLFPPGDHRHQAGQAFDVLLVEDLFS